MGTTGKLLKYLTVTMLIASTIGCTSSGSDNTKQFRAPNYATAGGNAFGDDIVTGNDWVIACSNGNHVSVARRETQQFYKEEGILKTKKEFCNDYESGTNIRRRK